MRLRVRLSADEARPESVRVVAVDLSWCWAVLDIRSPRHRGRLGGGVALFRACGDGLDQEGGVFRCAPRKAVQQLAPLAEEVEI